METENIRVENNRHSSDEGQEHGTESLAVSEQDFRALAESSPDCLGRHDVKGRFVYVNPQWEKVTKLTSDAVLGKTILEVIQKPEAEKYMNVIDQVLRTGDGAEIDLDIPDSGNVIRHYHVRLVAERGLGGKIAGVLSFGRDITECKRLEEEIIKADKLESLCILAGGIAHDFNNMLTVIMGRILQIGKSLSHNDKVSRSLDIAAEACNQAMELARRLICFAKENEPISKSVLIDSLLRNSLMLHGKRITVGLHLADDLCAVEAEEGQIQQVFDNLVVNAVQAMPNGGTLRVVAENAAVDEKTSPPLASGYYVKISFADEGCGIDERVMPKIFEPYFTTKPLGTGLGLASSYLIITRLGGGIFATSRPGHGSVFTVYLPAQRRMEPCMAVQHGQISDGNAHSQSNVKE